MKKTIQCLAALLALGVGSAVFTGCAGTSTKESTGEYIDNSALTAKVKSAFASDDIVKGRDIQVESFRGTVQLSGFVDTPQQKSHAEAIAESIQGVKAVKNNLIVK